MQQILYAANIIFGGRLCPGEYISSEISLLLLIQRVMLNAENLGRIFAVACTRKKNVIYLSNIIHQEQLSLLIYLCKTDS